MVWSFGFGFLFVICCLGFVIFFKGVDQCGQATKGVWGMPWRQEAMKGVEDCEKLGGLVKRELIPRSLNQPDVNP